MRWNFSKFWRTFEMSLLKEESCGRWYFILPNSKKFAVQWGWPTVSIGAVLGVFCGVMTSTIESLGDYFACASIASSSSFLYDKYRVLINFSFSFRNGKSSRACPQSRNFLSRTRLCYKWILGIGKRIYLIFEQHWYHCRNESGIETSDSR